MNLVLSLRQPLAKLSQLVEHWEGVVPLRLAMTMTLDAAIVVTN